MLKAGKAKKVTKTEREDVENEWKRWCSVAKRRTKIVGEMWKIIEDWVGDQERRMELREMFALDE